MYGGKADKSSNNNAVWQMAAVGALAGVGALAALRALSSASRRFDLHGKTVLITGGSRGLGLVLARRITEEGANVALCARDADELYRAQTDLIERGVPADHVFTTVCDVTDKDAIQRTIEATLKRFGAIDVLINNAGIIQVGPMETMTQADYEEAFAIHFWAPYHFTEAVLPLMRSKKAGRIVHIASFGGLMRFPHMLPYTSSKSALVGYAEGLRAELLKDSIYVTLVCPGLIRTGSHVHAYFKGQNEKEYAWFKISDSLPGVSQSAEDCVHEIVHGLKHGTARVVTSLPAKAMSLVHGVAPNLVVDSLGIVGGLMPDANGLGPERYTGAESETPLTRSALTALTESAARRNNQ